MRVVAEDRATRRPAPVRPWLKRRQVRRAIFQACVYLALTTLGVVFAMPLLWMLSTSLKSDTQLLVYPPVWLPNPILWSNYTKAWNYAPFNLYLRNTIVITSLALVGQVFSASVVAYGFARLRFPGRDTLFIGVLATMMLPGVVTLIPVFLVFKKLGWVNTFYPLTVPAYFGGGAFYIFMLRQYMRTIPLELSDAARIDGCSELGIFSRIVMPLSLPAVATVAIFSFLGSWNDFMGPLIYLNDESKKTLMLGLRSFIGQHSQQFQYMMAVSLLATLPTLLVFFLFQRVFIQSVVLTGIIERLGYSPAYGNPPSFLMWYIFLWQLGGEFMNEDKTRVTFNNDAGVGAMQFILDVTEMQGGVDAVDKFASALSPAPGQDVFMMGMMGMQVNGDWVVANFRQYAPDLRWGIGYIPIPEGGQKANYHGGHAWVLPRGCKHKEAAWKFVEWMLDEPHQLQSALAAGQIPALQELAESDEYLEGEPKEDAALRKLFVDEFKHAKWVPTIPGVGEIFAANIRAYDETLHKVKTPAEAVATMAQECQAIMDAWQEKIQSQ